MAVKSNKTVVPPERSRKMTTVSGLATSGGFASGPVFLYKTETQPSLSGRRINPEDVQNELHRFRNAKQETKRQIEELIGRLDKGQDIFSNHLALVDDPLLVASVERRISDELCPAEMAVQRAMGEFREVFRRMKDAYLRERERDLDDLERRLMRVLMASDAPDMSVIDRQVILVAEDLTPSETVSLPRDRILGIATDRGSTTSHVALLARALGIPAVVGLGDITSRVRSGEAVLLDGTNGTVTINPDKATRSDFDRLARKESDLMRRLSGDAGQVGALKDGTPIRFLANVQPGVPLASLSAFGAQGIGLYRSEYLWLGGDAGPSEDEQTAAYSEAVKAAASLGDGASVVIRVLDIGGDKIARSVEMREANPFLGCRSIRWLLSNRDVLRAQLRAILRASAHGRAAVLYPMIATLEELREANMELELAKRSLRAAGVAFDENIRRGCMIEIPSAALAADSLAGHVDFFSIGTNDLVQYTMAADRGNSAVSYLYQPAHPAVVRLVDAAVRAADAAGIHVSVCGESAADPVLGALWVGLGASSLSMGAGSIPLVSLVLRSLTSAEVEEMAGRVLEMCKGGTAAEIYSFCRDFVESRVPGLQEVRGSC